MYVLISIVNIRKYQYRKENEFLYAFLFLGLI